MAISASQLRRRSVHVVRATRRDEDEPSRSEGNKPSIASAHADNEIVPFPLLPPEKTQWAIETKGDSHVTDGGGGQTIAAARWSPLRLA